MDNLPFSPFQWPASICWLWEQASTLHWLALLLSIILYITQIDMSELVVSLTSSRLLPAQATKKFDAEVIAERIEAHCEWRKLSEAATKVCIAAGLQPYWKDARSIAWCVGVGCAKARTLK